MDDFPLGSGLYGVNYIARSIEKNGVYNRVAQRVVITVTHRDSDGQRCG